MLATGIVTLSALTPQAEAAVVAGTNNGDGSWSIGSFTITLYANEGRFDTRNGFVFTHIVNNNYSGSAYFRRSNDLASSNGNNTRSDFDYYINGRSGDGLQYGAVAGDDNWFLFSLESSEREWDTAVQFRFDAGGGIAGDEILNVWHDDSASGENVIAGVTSFNDIVAAVPEPSSTFLLGLGAVGLLIRRKR